MIKHVEDLNELQSEIKEGRVLVDFFATWCGPCRMVAPILEELDKDDSFAPQIVKVDVDDAPDAARAYGIQSIPTLLYFVDGKLANKAIGYLRKDQIIDFCK